MLLLLDRLMPEQRVVWVLRESVGLPYEEIGTILHKTPAACRQIFRRASVQIAPERTPPTTGSISTAQLDCFLSALQSGDVPALTSLLADDAVWIGDGGKERLATARPVIGADRVARGLTGLARKNIGGRWSLSIRNVNGGPGLIISVAGVIDACWLLLGDGDRITHVLNQRNFSKLTGIDPNAGGAGSK